MKTLPILLLVLGVLAPLRAERDARDRHDGRGRPEAARVVLYSGDDFDGVSIELLPGASVANLGDLSFADGRSVNDRISSIRIFGDLKVVVFSDSGFQGQSLELDRREVRLKRVPRRPGRDDWDNCITSVRISGGRSDDRADDRRPGFRRERDRDRVVESGGDRWHGDDYGPQRPRHRHEMSAGEVERLVGRAHRELLRREPTGAELRRYRELVFTEGWGRDEIYDDIRGSREFRSREADLIIERVYRDLLGREPDTAGREHWRRKIIDRGWSEGRFRDEIRKSDEYRRRR